MTEKLSKSSAARRRVSALDVAQQAGVSRSAVSRTFTKGATVSPATRARVLQAATMLGYRPNLLARGLITSRTGLIAVVLANLKSPFFSEFVERLTVGLRTQGYRILLLVVPSANDTDETLREALDYSIDGAILISAAPSQQVVADYDNAQVPIVLLDRRDGSPEIAMVWTDGDSVGAQVATIMNRDGRRRPVAMISAGRTRTGEFLAFAKAMEAAGSHPCLWVEVPLDYDRAREAADRLFEVPQTRPDAVFAATDIMAMGVLDSARLGYGIHVPQALSLVGIGDTSPAHWQSQRLSSVRLPISALIQTAISTLLDRIGGAETPAPRIWLDCDIVERGTTGRGE